MKRERHIERAEISRTLNFKLKGELSCESLRWALNSICWHNIVSLQVGAARPGRGRTSTPTDGHGLQPGASRYPVGPRRGLQGKLLTQLLPRRKLWGRESDGPGLTQAGIASSLLQHPSDSRSRQRSYHPSAPKEDVCLCFGFFPYHLVTICSGDLSSLRRKNIVHWLFLGRKSVLYIWGLLG